MHILPFLTSLCDFCAICRNSAILRVHAPLTRSLGISCSLESSLESFHSLDIRPATGPGHFIYDKLEMRKFM